MDPRVVDFTGGWSRLRRFRMFFSEFGAPIRIFREQPLVVVCRLGAPAVTFIVTP